MWSLMMFTPPKPRANTAITDCHFRMWSARSYGRNSEVATTTTTPHTPAMIVGTVFLKNMLFTSLLAHYGSGKIGTAVVSTAPMAMMAMQAALTRSSARSA